MRARNALKTPSQAVGKVLAANQKWKCGHCHRLLEATYQIDHRVPLCHGGSNAIDNLWILCASCHALKSLAEQQSSRNYGKIKKRRRYTRPHVSIALIECPFYQTFFDDAKTESTAPSSSSSSSRRQQKTDNVSESKMEKETEKSVPSPSPSRSELPPTTREDRYQLRSIQKAIDTKHVFCDFKIGDLVEARIAENWKEGKIVKCLQKTQLLVIQFETKSQRCMPSHVRIKV